MRYLKLFEAFSAKTISKTLSFLKSKVSDRESKKFLESFKESCSGLMIDKISDDDFKYMKSSKAIYYTSKSDPITINNKEVKGVHSIKYWFSLEDGFLGYSFTEAKDIPLYPPNLKVKYTNSKGDKKYAIVSDDQEGLADDMVRLESIRNNNKFAISIDSVEELNREDLEAFDEIEKEFIEYRKRKEKKKLESKIKDKFENSKNNIWLIKSESDTQLRRPMKMIYQWINENELDEIYLIIRNKDNDGHLLSNLLLEPGFLAFGKINTDKYYDDLFFVRENGSLRDYLGDNYGISNFTREICETKYEIYIAPTAGFFDKFSNLITYIENISNDYGFDYGKVRNKDIEKKIWDDLKDNYLSKEGNYKFIEKNKYNEIPFGVTKAKLKDGTREAEGVVLRPKSDDHNLYFVTNDSSFNGGNPRSDYPINWTRYGRYSWHLGSASRPAGDHDRLEIIKDDGIKLFNSKQVAKKEKYSEINKKSNLLPLSSFDDSFPETNIDINKADFALILEVKDLEKLSSGKLRKERKESKEGALKLKSDEEIRKENFDRYTSKLREKIGINSKDLNNLKLSNLVSKALRQDYCIFSIYRDDLNILHVIHDLLLNLFNSIESENKENAEYYLNLIEGKIKNIYSPDYLRKDKYNKFINEVKGKIENKDRLDYLIKFLEVSKVLNNKIKGSKIENLYDLELLINNLSLISNLMNRRGLFKLNSSLIPEVLGLITHLRKDDFLYYINSNNYDENEIKKDIQKLERLIVTISRKNLTE